MDKLLERCIRCPACKNDLCLPPTTDEGALVCPSCSAGYPVRDGVVDCLPNLVSKRSRTQVAMESNLIVSIYESRLWRRSPLFAVGTGIAFDAELDVIQRAAEITVRDHVLDLACGSGIYTRPFARAASKGRVVGLDLSWPMLRWAANRCAEEGLSNVVFTRASALELPFEDNSFQVVNCCGALHLFPDPEKALGEAARVLTPGGRLTLAAFRRTDGAFSERRARFFESAFGIRSFSPSGLDAMLAHKGFDNIVRHHDASVWLIVSAIALY